MTMKQLQSKKNNKEPRIYVPYHEKHFSIVLPYFRYEIQDGAPVKGESIPIRVFLAGYDLTPTMRDINKKFSVKYYLNLVLVDEEERRYFKQQVC